MCFTISQILDANTANILALNSIPLLCPLSIASDMHKSIIHGAGETRQSISYLLCLNTLKDAFLFLNTATSFHKTTEMQEMPSTLL